MAEIAEYVTAGARLLDEKKPGWHKKVKITTLDVADGGQCPLGQLYTTYWAGRDSLDLNVIGSYRHGFVASGRHDVNIDEEYRELTRLWKDEIRARRAK